MLDLQDECDRVMPQVEPVGDPPNGDEGPPGEIRAKAVDLTAAAIRTVFAIATPV